MHVGISTEVKRKVANIVGEEFLKGKKLEFTNLKEKGAAIKRSLKSVDQQYEAYPYLSKDWFVENSAERTLHFCRKYSDLKKLVDFLTLYGKDFDYLINGERTTLCKIVIEDSDKDAEAVTAAYNTGFRVLFLQVSVPESFDVEMM